ncbi:MAG TPA: FAD-dependent oxidoreductase [Candidatus Limnocylindria bacterium]|nr:FAD-dependent oxidoreductase [Candidatus Limnocylindria bacterium]
MGANAVVLGGSLAGLCAARALAERCERVTVIERDELPAGPVDRAGLPQGRHIHAMLERGRQELERLFPGFDAYVKMHGALELNFGTDFAVLRQTRWQPRRPYRLRGLFLSRPLVDAAARMLLTTHENVTLRPRTEVTGLVLHPEQRRITGVRVRARDGGGETTLAADLVVDASGRGSRAPEWLAALGITPPEESGVDSFCGYSTRWYEAPPAERWPRSWWWKGVWLDPDLSGPSSELTAGVLSPCEGNRWIVTIGGIAGNYPPTDEAGFTATLARLRSPIIAEAVALATPISPVYSSRMMANRFRHYERWNAVAGFLAVGDAVCAFNPIYGQGMTAAAVCGRLLREQVAAHGPLAADLPARVFAAQVGFLKQVWDLATGADFRFDTTEGKRPPLLKPINRYMDALFEASNDDLVIRDVAANVMHLLQPPTAFFAPGIALRVARHALAERIRAMLRPSERPGPWPVLAPS